MRNRFPGTCYRCGKHCAAGDGYFEKRPYGGWRVQHATCAIEHRKERVSLAEKNAAMTPNERTRARAERRKRAKTRQQTNVA